MIAVIIAGGKGTRLWPLSTSAKPKHLLSLTGKESLLRNTYERAKQCADTIYVVTDASHSDLVAEQLAELSADKIIVEPGRRDTASCIVLVLATISANHSDDAQIAFFPADHHIQNSEGFAESVQFAVKSSIEYDSIALIGIHPDYAATGFGYIKVGDRLDGAFKVDEFKEKPDQKTAEQYLESGKYLWNLGLFAGTLSIFKREFAAHSEHYSQGLDELEEIIEQGGDLSERYLALPKEPIDTALIEKSNNLVVIPGTFDWIDIGNFKDMHEVMPKSDELSNAVQGDAHLINTTNSMVVTHNKPVVVIGLDQVAVIDTPDGILVCHKEHAQHVKQAANQVADAQQKLKED